jgi:nitrogen regulatory protein P-II 1
MKKIEAFIRPYLLENVQEALMQLDITGMTISQVKGLGHQSGHTETYRGQEKEIKFLPKCKIEVLVVDEMVDECVKTIMLATRTGKIGDGKILVIPVDCVYRIRTGEKDSDATY